MNDLNIRFEHFSESDLDTILDIESKAYAYPWLRAHFEDALHSGNDCYALWTFNNILAGYLVLMDVIDETHLLNIAVKPDLQNKGFGGILIKKTIEIARNKLHTSVLLEVRPSNFSALRLYEKFGFYLIGRRKRYYPAPNGQREDACVMRCVFPITEKAEFYDV
jgi:[ribosomal protein S18]-alanine N-acetyltransferase